MQTPECIVLADDGVFPNSRLPVLLYRAALPLPAGGTAAASHCERILADHGWGNSWRNGIYDFPHYHSVAHEALFVYVGRATVRLGGARLGVTLELRAGDVVILPAGVAHENRGCSNDFRVVGAYPPGQEPDLCYGKPGERPAADHRLATVPLPTSDPLYGTEGPLVREWRGPG